MDPQAVSRGLVTVVEAADIGLNCYPFLPDRPSDPAFYVADISGDYDLTFGGMDDLTATVRILVSSSDDQDGQALLKEYLGRGPKSLKAAIEGTPGVAQTLGGACDDVHVKRFQRYGKFEHADDEFYGAELVVRIIGDPEE